VTDEIYIGRWYFGVHKVVGKKKRERTPKEDWELVEIDAILKEETFTQAEVIAKSVARKYARNAPKDLFMLRGRIRCGICHGMYSPISKEDGKYLYYIHTGNKREPYTSCPNRPMYLNKDEVEAAVREDMMYLFRADVDEIYKVFEQSNKDIQDQVDNISKARKKNAAAMARARKLRTDGEFSKEDWIAEKERLEADDVYLEQEERRLSAVVEPEYFDLMTPAEEADREKVQFLSSGVDYFSDDEWFQLCDSWNVEVEIVERADTPLKAVLRMVSDLFSSNGPFVAFSNGPNARPRCSKQM
jgi:hypothetical protein